MSKPKYNIRRLLYTRPGKFNANKYALCIETGLSERTLDRYMKVPQDSFFSIDSDLLYKMADFFKINPTDLLNVN